MTDLLKGGQDAITNFTKVYDELSGSTANATITQLALQQATVGMQEMVAQLRQRQAADQVVAAQTRVTDLTAEVAAAQSLLGTWTATETFIDGVLGQLLTVARSLADMVAEDVFLARRALEIYQLTDANSSYNSLQLSLTKRTSHGLTLTNAYTYAHCIDDASGLRTNSNPYSSSYDRGNCDTDVRHSYVGSAIYELPWFHDQRGFLGHVLGGFSLSTLVTLQSGIPFDITDGGDRSLCAAVVK